MISNKYNRLTRFLMLSVLVLGLAACGGGGGDANDSDTNIVDDTPPVAGNFLPINNDIEVEVDASISAHFDKELFALTLSDISVALTSGSVDNIPLTIAYDDAKKSVRLTPMNLLALATRYQVNLTTDITDLEGNALAETTWQFTTRDGNWDSNEVVISEDADFGFSSSVQVAFDDNKNARTVWSDQNDVLWTNTHVFGDDWDSPSEIGFINGRAIRPQFVMNSSGNGWVVWTEFNENSIWSRQYNQATGWSTPTALEADDGSADSVQIAADNEGNAIAVWSQRTNGTNHIWSNKYTSDTGWGAAQQIENIFTSVSASVPKIVMQGNGDALVVWRQSEKNANSGFTEGNIWSAAYSANTGWEAPQVVVRNIGFAGAGSPEIAMDGSGNVFMVWEQTNSRSEIWANRYSASDGWGLSQAIEQDPDTTHSAFAAKIAVNQRGDAIAVWEQRTTPGFFNVWANRYSVADGWGEEQLIESNDLATANSPQISLDDEGNALSVFEIGRRIWASRYRATEGWGEEEEIDVDVLGGSVFPQIAINNSGEAMAIWTHSQSLINVSNIRINHFR